MHIAVVIPCFNVRSHILSVLSQIGPEIQSIYVVDDKCPEDTGRYVASQSNDPRVHVLFNPDNRGVGGATITGYRQALADNAGIIVKLDGDGQMDPKLIPTLIEPIQGRRADYTKGNRFFDIESLSSMPKIRLTGNAVLSLINKFSSGYWDIMDPTNGFTAIHRDVLKLVPLHKIEERYFFESDMLFRLNIIRAVVKDIPMNACYGDEKSNLSIPKVAIKFPRMYLSRFVKRILYSYFYRDFNAGTIQILTGIFLIIVGGVYGALKWYAGELLGHPATSGTVMLAALPVILGFQLLVNALNFDVSNTPKDCLH